MSVLRLPSRRRSDDVDKPPLLALTVAGHSFLAADLRDDLAASPLYSVRTSNMTTSILRAATTAAQIKWPSTSLPKSKGKKAPDGVLLQLPGTDWIPANTFLKPSTSMDRPRKFRLPHYSHSMKWQKRASAYWCTTSTVKGPIATYEPPTDELPGRLTVYETLQDEHDISPLPVHRGVSILLLDYLLITCILLVTDSQECMVQASGQGSLSDFNSNTDFVWKKLAQGQYLFRGSPPVTAQASTPADYENEPATLISQGQVAGITQNDPLYPPSRQASTSTSHISFSSEPDNGNESILVIDAPPAEALAARPKSVIDSSPLVSSHSYSDSSLSADGGAPSALSYPTNDVREPPLSLATTPTAPQSSISEGPLPSESDEALRSDSSTAGPSSAASPRQSSPVSLVSRSRSISRPLPRTPSSPRAEPRGETVRLGRSHTRLDQRSVEKPWSPTAMPPLPPMPSMGVGRQTTTLNQGRSLPPTPYDLATSRTPSSMVTPTRAMTTGPDGYNGVQLVRKNFGSNLKQRGRSSDSPLGRMQTDQNGSSPTRPSFDCPPPAYSSIDFHAPNPGWKPDA